MFSRYNRLKLRRKFRARKKQISEKVDSANKDIERHIFRRVHNWQNARRFLIAWITLALVLIVGLLAQMRILSATYLQVTPVAGGVYNEGVVGNVQNINPLFASTTADMSVSALIFNGLVTYNEENKVVGDIAKEWTIDATRKIYTVQLRDDVIWHDGIKLTADDIVFTFQTIQNPDVKSRLYDTWRGIKVEKINDTTVQFTLPNAYSPFIHSLTTGILPVHILKDVPKEQLRSIKFNAQEAVGTGPFAMREVSVSTNNGTTSETIQLVKNPNYFKGPVQLDGFTIKTYADETALKDAILSKEIIGGVIDISNNDTVETRRFNQTSGMYLFMNTTRPPFNDAKIRQALALATNPFQVSEKLGYPVTYVNSPLLKDQVGYDASLTQITNKPEEANTLLTSLGWQWNEGNQYRIKDGKELTVQFVTENTPEYAKFAEELQRQWALVGVRTNVLLENPDDIGATSLTEKNYDALLYAINIGADPDVYAYWHSSQAKPDAKPGYNFSLYSSPKADQSLEDGRSRIDPTLRTIKYKPFLEAWKTDVPAIGFHQPVIIYTANIPVYNFTGTTLNTASERYKNVHNWQINTQKTTQQ